MNRMNGIVTPRTISWWPSGRSGELPTCARLCAQRLFRAVCLQRAILAPCYSDARPEFN